jgi:hypothetical protein
MVGTEGIWYVEGTMYSKVCRRYVEGAVFIRKVLVGRRQVEGRLCIKRYEEGM